LTHVFDEPSKFMDDMLEGSCFLHSRYVPPAAALASSKNDQRKEESQENPELKAPSLCARYLCFKTFGVQGPQPLGQIRTRVKILDGVPHDVLQRNKTVTLGVQFRNNFHQSSLHFLRKSLMGLVTCGEVSQLKLLGCSEIGNQSVRVTVTYVVFIFQYSHHFHVGLVHVPL
jgi:hypothetical protein